MYFIFIYDDVLISTVLINNIEYDNIKYILVIHLGLIIVTLLYKLKLKYTIIIKHKL